MTSQIILGKPLKQNSYRSNLSLFWMFLSNLCFKQLQYSRARIMWSLDNSHNCMLPHWLRCMDNSHILLNSHNHYSHNCMTPIDSTGFDVRIIRTIFCTFLCKLSIFRLPNFLDFSSIFFSVLFNEFNKYKNLLTNKLKLKSRRKK